MISKLAKQILNITVKKPQVFKPAIFARQACSFNFTSLETVKKSESRLLKAVQREIQYETENYQQDSSIQEFLKEHNFTLKEDQNSIFIELHKDIGENKVQILFQAKSPQTDEQMPENEGQENQQQQQQQQDQQNEEEQQQQLSDYSDFIVYIAKPNGKSMVFDCSSFESEIQVNQVNVVDNIEQHKAINRFERATTQYNGPDFNVLDERLQTSLVEFLKSNGVNEEIAAFIEHFSLDKEQRLYMKWLKQVQEFMN
ncbi:mitochondrial glycoprotein domain protein [Ichthyophthirius multifiliis]|uniref:Mitochondrial glycoprotein domain protein n=1 Tax=Ichthyophthirius multifiliis TaxID=5932 RepID=G0QX80_ICHMU|nr:mitochondrial glycoprotein domain protein [Ichthyophthirius multifiliis]EGR30173.1 mitochondrial glycoprotein domain protein [Ichthyophthirius multifiliis]|eukprot:XP_004031409.1 mitochondrial glycoprotein domain protein [Ichthyophthirius multifiliis]